MLSHATGRQRLEGSDPSGNSSGTNVIARLNPGTQVKALSHDSGAPPGSEEPGLVTRAYSAYVPANCSRPWEKPTAKKIQPRGFLGRWEAFSAPRGTATQAAVRGLVLPWSPGLALGSGLSAVTAISARFPVTPSYTPAVSYDVPTTPC